MSLAKQCTTLAVETTIWVDIYCLYNNALK